MSNNGKKQYQKMTSKKSQTDRHDFSKLAASLNCWRQGFPENIFQNAIFTEIKIGLDFQACPVG